MMKSMTIAVVLALISAPLGMATAAKRTTHPTSVRKATAQGASNLSARGKRVLLSAKKRQAKQASTVSHGDLLTQFGAADHPLQLEADLHAADSVEDPSERVQAVAKARQAIAKYDAKNPGQPWEASIAIGNLRHVLKTNTLQKRAAKSLRSLGPTVLAITANVLAAVIGISVGHDLVDVGQGGSPAVSAIALVGGYANLGMATYLVRELRAAKSKLADAVDASARAFVRFAEFSNLIQRTGSTK